MTHGDSGAHENLRHRNQFHEDSPLPMALGHLKTNKAVTQNRTIIVVPQLHILISVDAALPMFYKLLSFL